jgi:hypothetical protein
MTMLKEILIEAVYGCQYVGATLAELAKEAVREAPALARRARRRLTPASPDVVADVAVEDAMAAALEQIQRYPADMTHDGRYYHTVVNNFIAEHHGGPGVDLDGAYGPQSPDLITAYIRQFQPGWMFRLGAAAKLWNQHAMPAGFIAIPAGKNVWPERGDILVTPATALEPFGNVGVVAGTEAAGARVLTQTPEGCRFHTYPLNYPAGYWRWVGVPA